MLIFAENDPALYAARYLIPTTKQN